MKILQDGTSPENVAGFYCSAGHINEALEKALVREGYKWKRTMVEYDIDLKKTFFFEPIEDYPELWHKRKELAYQHESRIIIFDNKDIPGIPLQYELITEHSGNCASGPLYIEGASILQPACNTHGEMMNELISDHRN